MRPDLFLRLLAEQTGERLWAIDLDHLGAAAAAPAQREPALGVAVLPLQGVLTPRAVKFFGMTLSPGLEGFRASLAAAVADPNVGAIVLDVHSPGGPIGGLAETGAAVKAASAIKPVVSIADSCMASAAYWIASQANQVWASPSADVGSIGVMGQHIDATGALEQDGLKSTLIRSKSAPKKNEANPYEALSDEALAYLQSQCDDAEDDFIGQVAAGRGVSQDKVRADFGQGRMLNAAKALKAGMVDKIGTMADVAQSLRTKSGGMRRRFSALSFT
jgi:capsid assembly protease